jgi:vacuolar-type H+-ATPase subunit E/Vma4
LGLEELLGRLERDAGARIAEIEARARGEIDAIEGVAALEASRASEEALASLRAQRRTRLEHELAEARQFARAERLRAEHALLERVLIRAAQLLEVLPLTEGALSALSTRLSEALPYLDGRAARVRCRPAFAQALREITSARRDVTLEEVVSMPAGFSVVADDGSVEVDDTLASRLQRMRPRLLVELLAAVDRR